MNALIELRDATLAARAIDPAIGTSVKEGLLRVNRTIYGANGVSTVDPVSGWMTMADVIDFMRGFVATV
jgi:hypothetical protein